MSKDTAQAINFIRQEDGDMDALMLAASLTALGIPFSERPAFSVRGDTQPVVNRLFDESSPDGKHRASECIARWNDKAFLLLEYPFSALQRP